jgi:hypothetical protein
MKFEVFMTEQNLDCGLLGYDSIYSHCFWATCCFRESANPVNYGFLSFWEQYQIFVCHTEFVNIFIISKHSKCK